MTGERPPTYEELAALVVEQARMIDRLRGQLAEMEGLRARVAELERQLGQNSGNSGKPPSRDSTAERQRQAAERKAKAEAAGGAKRRRGKQKGAKGKTLEMSDIPDEIVDHRPQNCSGCGSALEGSAECGYKRRQVVEVPPVKPVIVEHPAHNYLCGCGYVTTAEFPDQARAPVS